jgi:hypothetical protein
MATNDYPVVVPVAPAIRPIVDTTTSKDIEIYSLLDAMIKAKDFLQFLEFIEYNPWILFVWVWFKV